MAPGEAATPLAAPLVSGPLGRVSPLRMNKTMIRRTTAGITIPLQVARPHGAVSAPPSMKRDGTRSSRPAPRMDIWTRELGGGKICPRPPTVVRERCLWLRVQQTQPGPAATVRAPATRGCTYCCAASRWSRQVRGGDGSTPPRHRSHWHPSSGFLGHRKCSRTPCPPYDGRRHSPKPTLATRGGRG